jgi:hypothetical protein
MSSTEADIQKEASQKLNEAFPVQPISDPKLLISRNVTLERCRNILDTPGQSLVLYGDFGVGKTSVWRVLLHAKKYQEISADKNTSVPQLFLQLLNTYGLGTTLEKITTEVKSEIGVSVPGGPSAKVVAGGNQTERPIEPRRLNIPVLTDEILKLQGRLEYLVIEEAHRLTDKAAQGDLVSLMKTLSDRNETNIKIIVVGTAKSELDLLGSAAEFTRYQGRMIQAVEVPPFSDHEVIELLTSREKSYNIRFIDGTKEQIAYVSAGYPYVANQLAQKACYKWLIRNLRNIAESIEIRGIWRTLKNHLSQNKTGKREIRVAEQDLLRAVEEVSQGANFPSVQWFRKLQLKDGEDEQYTLTLIHYLSSRDEPMSLHEASELLGIPEPRVQQVQNRYGGKFLRIGQTAEMFVDDQSLRWYPRSIEYLSPRSTGVDFGHFGGWRRMSHRGRQINS